MELRDVSRAVCEEVWNDGERLQQILSESRIVVHPGGVRALVGPAWMRNNGQKLWCVFVEPPPVRQKYSAASQFYRRMFVTLFEGALLYPGAGPIIVNMPAMAVSDEEHRAFLTELIRQFRFVRYQHRITLHLVLKHPHESAEVNTLMRMEKVHVSQGGDIFKLPVMLGRRGAVSVDVFYDGRLQLRKAHEDDPLPLPVHCLALSWRKPVTGAKGSSLCDQFVSGAREAAKLPNSSALLFDHADEFQTIELSGEFTD